MDRPERIAAWAQAALGVALLAGALSCEARAQQQTAPPLPTVRRFSWRTTTGTLTAYDRRTRVLTLRSASGVSTFQVAGDARAWLGRRRLPVGQLGAHLGAQVTVAFGEADGVRTTHTVRLAEIDPNTVK